MPSITEPQSIAANKRENIRRYMGMLYEQMVTNEAQLVEHPHNWGYVGELSHIEAKLEELLNIRG